VHTKVLPYLSDILFHSLATMAELDLLAITVCADPSQEYNDLVPSGLQHAAQKWECTVGKEQLSSTFSYKGKKSTRLGNRPIAENTKDNYEGNFGNYGTTV